MALRIIAWPMGYIIVAKGERALLVCTEVAAAVVHLGLAFLLVPIFGLAGATMGFFGLYVWHGLFVYVIDRKLTGFRWSAATRDTALVYLVLIAVVFGACVFMPGSIATAIGSVGLLCASAYSWRTLRGLLGAESIPAKWTWLRR
jgi:PST family polysaccharide transporter